MFNTSAILRTAHAAAKVRMQPTRIFSYALDWCPATRQYVQPLPYRTVFAQELRKAWAAARPIAPAVLSPIAAQAAALREAASYEPLTAAGAAAFRALHAEAAALEAGRRAA